MRPGFEGGFGNPESTPALRQNGPGHSPNPLPGVILRTAPATDPAGLANDMLRSRDASAVSAKGIL